MKILKPLEMLGLCAINREGKRHESQSSRVCKRHGSRRLLQDRNKVQGRQSRRERVGSQFTRRQSGSSFEGEEEAVKALIEFCKRGPPGARVINIDLTCEDFTGEFDGFKIKYGHRF